MLIVDEYPFTHHAAHRLRFPELQKALELATSKGLLYEQTSHDGLRLYCYSDDTVYQKRWDTTTLLARGIIIDPAAQRIVATPFPKFFNLGEVTPHTNLPNLPFETFEKLDGSLIIIFYHNGWRCATKGSFTSDQSRWAEQLINQQDLSVLKVGTTYLAEGIYPENKIVVNYGNRNGLTLLAAYDENGHELSFQDITETAKQLSWAVASRYSFTSITELADLAKQLDHTSEGWVIRFSNGLRVKIKGDEYCRIHRMIANLTPLAIWRALRDGDDLETIRKQLPEEFLNDFDEIVFILLKKKNDLSTTIQAQCSAIAHLSDREIGMSLMQFPEDTRKFIFPYRKNKMDSDTTHRAFFDVFRPSRNRLDGYSPSSSMSRAQENLKE